MIAIKAFLLILLSNTHLYIFLPIRIKALEEFEYFYDSSLFLRDMEKKTVTLYQDAT